MRLYKKNVTPLQGEIITADGYPVKNGDFVYGERMIEKMRVIGRYQQNSSWIAVIGAVDKSYRGFTDVENLYKTSPTERGIPVVLYLKNCWEPGMPLPYDNDFVTEVIHDGERITGWLRTYPLLDLFDPWELNKQKIDKRSRKILHKLTAKIRMSKAYIKEHKLEVPK